MWNLAWVQANIRLWSCAATNNVSLAETVQPRQDLERATAVSAAAGTTIDRRRPSCRPQDIGSAVMAPERSASRSSNVVALGHGWYRSVVAARSRPLPRVSRQTLSRTARTARNAPATAPRSGQNRYPAPGAGLRADPRRLSFRFRAPARAVLPAFRHRRRDRLRRRRDRRPFSPGPGRGAAARRRPAASRRPGGAGRRAQRGVRV